MNAAPLESYRISSTTLDYCGGDLFGTGRNSAIQSEYNVSGKFAFWNSILKQFG